MPDGFVWPGHGIENDVPVWGHRDGMRIGLAPTPGPRGLLRVYAPYLDQVFPRVVNYISFEPTVEGQERRGQSELATSKHTPGTEGLDLYPSETVDGYSASEPLPFGVVTPDGSTLTIFVHTEPFPNGAEPIVRVRFHRDEPHEVELATFASAASAPITSSVLSATMGNFGLLHRLQLEPESVTANDLWSGSDELSHLDFLPWRTIDAERLSRTDDGRYTVTASTDADYSDLVYDESVVEFWHYVGRLASHTWMTEPDADPVVAVNARRTYWRSQAPIPGGTTIENFELRTAFVPGQRFWFRVGPDSRPRPAP